MKVYLKNKGVYALIDDEDSERVLEYGWHLDDMGYARCKNRTMSMRLHTFIMGRPDKGMVIDHINRDRLDNRKQNLRFLPHRHNLYNKAPTKQNTSGYGGVSWDRFRGKWKATFASQSLGRFSTIEEAINARKLAERSLV